MRRALGLVLTALGAWMTHRGLERLPWDERETLASQMVDALEARHVKGEPFDAETRAALLRMFAARPLIQLGETNARQ